MGSSTEARAAQPEKAKSPIDVVDLGTVIFVILSQSYSALLPIFMQPVGIVISPDMLLRA
ncbi:hypothetical protein PRLR6025_19760 [Prevotella lacticifex]|nr:hypothetical protein PRLR6025_19760 [Prevotella lacticifex]